VTTGAFLDHVLDRLGELNGLRTKAMFGGHGLYLDGTFFGIVFDDRLFFRTDDETRSDYERAGMEPFRPNERQTLKNYYEVPPDVIEEPVVLEEWALTAVDAGDG
jgi:DNA transformation protein